jgi:hypothetical protein
MTQHECCPHIYVMCNPEYEPVRYQFLVGHFARVGIPEEKNPLGEKYLGIRFDI